MRLRRESSRVWIYPTDISMKEKPKVTSKKKVMMRSMFAI